MQAATRVAALSWAELGKYVRQPKYTAQSIVHGPTNAHARLRLFGKQEKDVRVTLFRDNHAWCPYCQKVWLWLEEKQVPYRVEKVTMFCYGKKESWYKRKVPSGMLPALELDGEIITESDDILVALESEFGPLQYSMRSRQVVPLRQLERHLFRAWCRWLCYPARSQREETANRQNFEQVAAVVDGALGATSATGPFFLGEFSTADVIFTPYIERMSASLFYYKGFTLRDPSAYPNISAWFDAMETRSTYLGTQSDFHTHNHDLPPQMGGCYANGTRQQQANCSRIDNGPFYDTAEDGKSGAAPLPELSFAEPREAASVALERTLRHKDKIIAANPTRRETIDEALRCALTYLATGQSIQPKGKGADIALRYIRDRINVPRDMPIWSARRMRQALEHTAALAGDGQGPAIPVEHRRDQDPRVFA